MRRFLVLMVVVPLLAFGCRKEMGVVEESADSVAYVPAPKPAPQAARRGAGSGRRAARRG